MNASIKDALQKIKEIFSSVTFEETTPTLETYKLADGTEIQAANLDVGSEVMIGEALAPAGTYILEDESSIVVDEAGKITEVVAKPESELPPEEQPMTPEEMKAASEKFVTGTPEERLEAMAKCLRALMEYNFGWKMREAEEKTRNDEAIAAYKNGFEAQEVKLKTMHSALTELMELVEEIAAEPSGELPAEKKKLGFSKLEGKKAGLAKYAEAAKKMNETKN